MIVVMPILFHWLFRGCMGRALGTLAALLAIYGIIEAFDKARYLGRGLDAGLLIEYLALKTPFMISEFMPIIVLVAASIYITEISHHHELVALRAAGLGINKLMMPLLAVALLAAALSFTIGEWVTPVTNQRLDTIERVHIHHKADTRHGVQWLKDGNRFFRLTPLGNSQFAMIMLETDSNGSWKKRMDATRARYADGQWLLSDVHVSMPEADEGMRLYHRVTARIVSATSPDTADPPKPRHMQFFELGRYTRNLEQAGLSASTFAFAWHRKLAAPVACIIMVILAAALCMHMGSRIGASSWGMIGAIALGLIFYVFGNASYLLANSERLPAFYAAWLPDLFFGGIAGFLLLHREGK
ncbi:MAG: LptF/LptG family permease [Mariprofundaceae bacterium]